MVVHHFVILGLGLDREHFHLVVDLRRDRGAVHCFGIRVSAHLHHHHFHCHLCTHAPPGVSGLLQFHCDLDSHTRVFVVLVLGLCNHTLVEVAFVEVEEAVEGGERNLDCFGGFVMREGTGDCSLRRGEGRCGEGCWCLGC